MGTERSYRRINKKLWDCGWRGVLRVSTHLERGRAYPAVSARSGSDPRSVFRPGNSGPAELHLVQGVRLLTERSYSEASFKESDPQEPLSRGRTKCVPAAQRTVDGDQVRLCLRTAECTLVLSLEQRPLGIEHLEEVRASRALAAAASSR